MCSSFSTLPIKLNRIFNDDSGGSRLAKIKNQTYIIEILNWDKWQDSQCGKKHWVKLDKTYFHDPRIRELNAAAKLVFVYTLCESGIQNSREVVTKLHEIALSCSLRANFVQNAIEILQQNRLIILKKAVNKKREEKKRKEKTFCFSFSFDKIYQAYPRKVNREEGFKLLEETVRNDQDFEDLKAALENYKSTQRPMKYVLNFDNFCRQWQRFIPIQNLSTTQKVIWEAPDDE